MTRILIVEDEPNMVAGLRDNFEFEGYTVITAPDGVAGLERALNEVSGSGDPRRHDASHERPGRLQATEDQTAVGANHHANGTWPGSGQSRRLGIGADDYVTKPFSIRELLAQRESRSSPLQDRLPKSRSNYSFGEVEVNLKSCQVSRSGNELDFSSKEFELLKYFLCHPGEALSRDRLLEEVWGYDRFPTTRTVDAHIVRLRQKVEPRPEEPRFILTVHGTGYKFVG